MAVGQAQKKKENPYLSHRGVARVFEHSQNNSESNTTNSSGPILDERIKSSNRDIRAKRAFNFIEAGCFCSFYFLKNPRNICQASWSTTTQRGEKNYCWVLFRSKSSWYCWWGYCTKTRRVRACWRRTWKGIIWGKRPKSLCMIFLRLNLILWLLGSTSTW